MRVSFLLAAAVAATTLAATSAGAETIRVGYQKYGTMILLKQSGALERALAPLGDTVAWKLFTAGPQLMEALGAGALDVGDAGETPPIFAEVAGVDLVYVGVEPPAPEGEAILVPKDSPIHTVADLRGRQIGFNRGSNVQYLLLRALAEAHVPWSAIRPVYLAPPDARAAFETGSLPAWAIWDPYLSAAEAALGARVLRDGTGLVANHEFYLATRRFATREPAAVRAVLAALAAADREIAADPTRAAAAIAPAVGLPAPVIATALSHMGKGAKPMDQATATEQQNVADAFFAAHLIPAPVRIREALLPGD